MRTGYAGSGGRPRPMSTNSSVGSLSRSSASNLNASTTSLNSVTTPRPRSELDSLLAASSAAAQSLSSISRQVPALHQPLSDLEAQYFRTFREPTPPTSPTKRSSSASKDENRPLQNVKPLITSSTSSAPSTAAKLRTISDAPRPASVSKIPVLKSTESEQAATLKVQREHKPEAPVVPVSPAASIASPIRPVRHHTPPIDDSRAFVSFPPRSYPHAAPKRAPIPLSRFASLDVARKTMQASGHRINCIDQLKNDKRSLLSIECVYLGDNDIEHATDLSMLAHNFPNIKSLSLINNLIDCRALLPLRSLARLSKIALEGCPLVAWPNGRLKAIAMLPDTVTQVDGKIVGDSDRVLAQAQLRQEAATLRVMFSNFTSIVKLRHIVLKLKMHAEFLQLVHGRHSVFNRWPLFAASSTTGFFLPAVPSGLISRPLESLSAAGTVSQSQPAALSGDFEMDVHRLLNMIDLTQTIDSSDRDRVESYFLDAVFVHWRRQQALHRSQIIRATGKEPSSSFLPASDPGLARWHDAFTFALTAQQSDVASLLREVEEVRTRVATDLLKLLSTHRLSHEVPSVSQHTFAHSMSSSNMARSSAPSSRSTTPSRIPRSVNQFASPDDATPVPRSIQPTPTSMQFKQSDHGKVDVAERSSSAKRLVLDTNTDVSERRSQPTSPARSRSNEQPMLRHQSKLEKEKSGSIDKQHVSHYQHVLATTKPEPKVEKPHKRPTNAELLEQRKQTRKVEQQKLVETWDQHPPAGQVHQTLSAHAVDGQQGSGGIGVDELDVYLRSSATDSRTMTSVLQSARQDLRAINADDVLLLEAQKKVESVELDLQRRTHQALQLQNLISKLHSKLAQFQKENTDNVQAAEAETSRLMTMLEASERKCAELEAESMRARDGELRMKQQAEHDRAELARRLASDDISVGSEVSTSLDQRLFDLKTYYQSKHARYQQLLAKCIQELHLFRSAAASTAVSPKLNDDYASLLSDTLPDVERAELLTASEWQELFTAGPLQHSPALAQHFMNPRQSVAFVTLMQRLRKSEQTCQAQQELLQSMVRSLGNDEVDRMIASNASLAVTFRSASSMSQHKLLKGVLQTWRERFALSRMTRKNTQARAFEAVVRCFRRLQENQRQALAVSCMSRVALRMCLRRTLQSWLTSAQRITLQHSQLSQAVEYHVHKQKALLFFDWLKQTRVTVHRRRHDKVRAEQICISKLQRRYLTLWRQTLTFHLNEQRNQRAAEVFEKTKVLHSYLSRWRACLTSVLAQRRVLSIASTYRAEKLRSKQHHVLCDWIASTKRKHSFLELQKQNVRKLLSAAFGALRTKYQHITHLQDLSIPFVRQRLLRSAFARWCATRVLQARVRRLTHTADEFNNELVVVHGWQQWRKRFEKYESLSGICRSARLFALFRRWRKKLKHVQTVRQSAFQVSERVEWHQKQRFAECFRLWLKTFRHRQTMAALYQHFDAIQRRRILGVCFNQWRTTRHSRLLAAVFSSHKQLQVHSVELQQQQQHATISLTAAMSAAAEKEAELNKVLIERREAEAQLAQRDRALSAAQAHAAEMESRAHSALLLLTNSNLDMEAAQRMRVRDSERARENENMLDGVNMVLQQVLGVFEVTEFQSPQQARSLVSSSLNRLLTLMHEHRQANQEHEEEQMQRMERTQTDNELHMTSQLSSIFLERVRAGEYSLPASAMASTQTVTVKDDVSVSTPSIHTPVLQSQSSNVSPQQHESPPTQPQPQPSKPHVSVATSPLPVQASPSVGQTIPMSPHRSDVGTAMTPAHAMHTMTSPARVPVTASPEVPAITSPAPAVTLSSAPLQSSPAPAEQSIVSPLQSDQQAWWTAWHAKHQHMLDSATAFASMQSPTLHVAPQFAAPVASPPASTSVTNHLSHTPANDVRSPAPSVSAVASPQFASPSIVQGVQPSIVTPSAVVNTPQPVVQTTAEPNPTAVTPAAVTVPTPSASPPTSVLSPQQIVMLQQQQEIEQLHAQLELHRLRAAVNQNGSDDVISAEEKRRRDLQERALAISLSPATESAVQLHMRELVQKAQKYLSNVAGTAAPAANQTSPPEKSLSETPSPTNNTAGNTATFRADLLFDASAPSLASTPLIQASSATFAGPAFSHTPMSIPKQLDFVSPPQPAPVVNSQIVQVPLVSSPKTTSKPKKLMNFTPAAPQTPTAMLAAALSSTPSVSSQPPIPPSTRQQQQRARAQALLATLTPAQRRAVITRTPIALTPAQMRVAQQTFDASTTSSVTNVAVSTSSHTPTPAAAMDRSLLMTPQTAETMRLLQAEDDLDLIDYLSEQLDMMGRTQ